MFADRVIKNLHLHACFETLIKVNQILYSKFSECLGGYVSAKEDHLQIEKDSSLKRKF